MRFNLLILYVLILLLGAGCSAQKAPKKSNDVSIRVAQEATQNPMSPEQAEEVLEVAGENYVYGHGVGNTVVNIGTTVLFPPYGLYLLGNALLDYGGYETYYVTDALPEEGKEGWDTVYGAITSAPGRAAAAIFGEEFRDKEEANRRLEEVIEKYQDQDGRPQDSRFDSQTGS